jgi:Tfp pilus assembly protein PilX
MKTNRRGFALYLVLAIMLVVVILANIVLNLITSQSKLTHHQIKRIQEYYAAQAGVNYALENLRVNNTPWMSAAGDNKTYYICRQSGAAPCNNIDGNNTTDSDLPTSINYVKITVAEPNATGDRPVSAQVNFTSPD